MNDELKSLQVLAKARGFTLAKAEQTYRVTKDGKTELRARNLGDVRQFLMSPERIIRQAIPHDVRFSGGGHA